MFQHVNSEKQTFKRLQTLKVSNLHVQTCKFTIYMYKRVNLHIYMYKHVNLRKISFFNKKSSKITKIQSPTYIGRLKSKKQPRHSIRHC